MARVYATIGRANDNDIVLDHPTVSNHHARLSWQGTSLLVEDLSSANGTYVDGSRVSLQKIRPGVELRAGQASVPWSHPGLRALLKAGIGARTLVMPAANVQSYVCGRCGQMSPLPAGPLPPALSCPKCKATLRAATQPKGPPRSPLVPALLGVAGLALVTGSVTWLATGGAATRDLGLRAGLERAKEATIDVGPVGGEMAEKLARAIDPMDPVTRNTAVKIAARMEGPFHVEQIAEIWAEVRKPWRYVNDPEGRDYFATARETIENGYVGDCDDFAITLVSMITAIGGRARVVLMDGPRGGHAYAEACVQGTPEAVATALVKQYRTRFKRYVEGRPPTQVAFRSSADCPIWLNLDWNSTVPGGPYEPEAWAVAVYEGGRREQLAPAAAVAAVDAPPNEPPRPSLPAP